MRNWRAGTVPPRWSATPDAGSWNDLHRTLEALRFGFWGEFEYDTPEAALEAEALAKRYGDIRAIKMDMMVRDGTLFVCKIGFRKQDNRGTSIIAS